MAGSYPDYPSNRFAYDVDGTRVFVVDLSTASYTELDAATRQSLNDVSINTLPAASRSKGIAFIFPEPRSLCGSIVWSDGGGSLSFSKYNGGDIELASSWEPVGDMPCSTGSFSYAARSGFVGSAVDDVSGVMFSSIGATSPSSGLGFVHLFGASGYSDRLEVIDHVLDERAYRSLFDWGSVPIGSSDDQAFRIKNKSESLFASSITVSVEDVGTPASPSVAAQHLLSIDDGFTFSATVTIDELAPTQASAPIVLRRVTPTTAQTGQWPFRVAARAGSWL